MEKNIMKNVETCTTRLLPIRVRPRRPTFSTDAVLPVMEPNIPSRSTPIPLKENITAYRLIRNISRENRKRKD